jgi:hypothetical protein
LGKIQSIRDCDAAKIFPPQLTKQQKRRQRAQAQLLLEAPLAK